MDTPEELAKRLIAGLDQLPDRSEALAAAAAAQSFAAAAEQTRQQLEALPDDLARLLQTADSGFPAAGAWVEAAMGERGKQVGKLARAALMVAEWHGNDGALSERMFVIRGNIRGWAHRWRTDGKGSAQVDDDPAFVEFAQQCLALAGIEDPQGDVISKALRSDWRTAPL